MYMIFITMIMAYLLCSLAVDLRIAVVDGLFYGPCCTLSTNRIVLDP